MESGSKVYVAGHKGMVGAAIKRELERQGYSNIVGADSKVLDLRIQKDVEKYFADERPEYVFLAAAKVGGIHANNVYRAEFLYDNLAIAANVIHAAYRYGAKKLLFLGSSCIYPKYAVQPLSEDMLLTGSLEPTNEPYAIAKIAGIKLCETYRAQYGANFISAMPCNLYGPGDNYQGENSHVIPALIKKFHAAILNDSSHVTIWGSGTPLREFMYVDDLAEACLYLMKQYDGSQFVNVGSGEEISIAQLADCIKEVTGYKGDIKFDSTRPDGTPRKLMDSSRLHSLGWMHKTKLYEGLQKTYERFLADNAYST